MKKRWRNGLLLLAAVIIAAAVLLNYPFKTAVQKEVAATVYRNGVPMEETALQNDGVLSKTLCSDEPAYTGRFGVPLCERTCREDVTAKIRWSGGTIWQIIAYTQNASVPEVGLNQELLIDEEMNDIALELDDGSVIATSQAVYDRYQAYKNGTEG